MRRSGNIYGRGAKGRATRLHAEIVRMRGVCERCGATEQLECAHIISRRYSATRTDLTNAFCLCKRCHMWFTDHPVAFGDFCREKLGDETVEALHQRAAQPTKVDWDAECRRLTLIADFQRAAREMS